MKLFLSTLNIVLYYVGLFLWFHCLVCNVSLRDNEDCGGYLEMGEVVLVEMIVVGTPIRFIMFPNISIRYNQISFQIYLETITYLNIWKDYPQENKTQRYSPVHVKSDNCLR